jgi:hypothetical protein
VLDTGIIKLRKMHNVSIGRALLKSRLKCYISSVLGRLLFDIQVVFKWGNILLSCVFCHDDKSRC